MYRRAGGALLKVWPLALAIVFVAGVAVASIPDAQGVIHGCYVTVGGKLRVIDSDRSQKCKGQRPHSTGTRLGRRVSQEAR